MRKEKGFTLIELLVVILIIGILIALLVPNFQQFQERARKVGVKTSMHTVMLCLEAYASDHAGYYPPAAENDVYGIPGDAVPAGDISCYFPTGEPFLLADPDAGGIAGRLPNNPYLGIPYNNDGLGVMNLVYFDETNTSPGAVLPIGGCGDKTIDGVYAACTISDAALSGFIGVACGNAEEDAGYAVTEYGIYGYGMYRSDDQPPMYEMIADPADPGVMIINFVVLNND